MSSISIIIPCYNEEIYVANCIESILSSHIEVEQLEIIFIDGNSSDKTVKIIEEYIVKYPYIKLLFNSKKHTPISMNMGIKASNGDYIFILSAHAKYSRDYFSKLTYHCKELDAQCIGGVLTTDVKNRNKKSNSIKEVLTSKFGVGNASFRTGSNTIKEVDTVAFGCYHKKTFEKYGLFDERLIRNQDIELNKRIINGGGKIYLIPEVKATYFARENFKNLATNNYSNGFWNILTAYYTKTFNSLSLRHFIPLIFVLSLFLPLIASLFYKPLVWIFLLSSGSYLCLVIIISFKLKKRLNSFFYLLLSFITLHFSYGVGSLVGIFSLISATVKGLK